MPGTLRGNSLPGNPAPTIDTSGAYGWFKPTVPVAQLTFTDGRRIGLPSAQFWLAAPAPNAVITGSIVVPDSPVVPPDTVVAILDSSGTPILDLEDNPIVVPVRRTAPSLSRPTGSYQLDVVPPPGFVDPPAVVVIADAAVVTVPPIIVELAALPGPGPAAGPELAASGVDADAPFAIAAVALAQVPCSRSERALEGAPFVARGARS